MTKQRKSEVVQIRLTRARKRLLARVARRKSLTLTGLIEDALAVHLVQAIDRAA